MLSNKLVAVIGLALLGNYPLSAQITPVEPQSPPAEQVSQDAAVLQDSGTNSSSQPDPGAPVTVKGAAGTRNEQPKRILGILPNFRSVSADTQLPPLSAKEKFGLATRDSVDYTSLIMPAFIAGFGHLNKSIPEFGQGPKGYARYYWHALADQVVGNYSTEAIVPTLTHEDPRYYTLGRGSILHRTGYALSRLVITKTDSGQHTFNFSEVLGNGLGSGISNLYYPAEQRTWVKTRQKWTTQIALDGLSNILKEFWPDIAARFSHKQ